MFVNQGIVAALQQGSSFDMMSILTRLQPSLLPPFEFRLSTSVRQSDFERLSVVFSRVNRRAMPGTVFCFR